MNIHSVTPSPDSGRGAVKNAEGPLSPHTVFNRSPGSAPISTNAPAHAIANHTSQFTTIHVTLASTTDNSR